MFDPETSSAPTNGIMFYVPQPLSTLEQLRSYISQHNTAEPISATELINARLVTSFDELSEPPDVNDFTPAEAAYLIAIIDHCSHDPSAAERLIRFEPDDEAGVDIEILFPGFLEPPAELVR